jgi:ABC-type transport system involved in cytochrome c biogenesis permease component
LHPVVWLAGRHWLRSWLVWVTILIAVAGYAGLAELEGDNDWWEPPALVLLSYGLHLLLKLWIALEAPRQFYEDRRSGALELLLTTPVRVEEAVRARVQALRRLFLGPCLLVLAGDWLVMIFAWDSGKDDDFMHWLMAWGAHMFTLLFDGYALAWYGNWLGLAATGKRTTFHAVLRVLLLPWILWIAGVTLFAVADGPRGLGGDDALVLSLRSWVLSLLSWVTCGAGLNLLWVHRARRGLLTRFREVAVQPVRQRRMA